MNTIPLCIPISFPLADSHPKGAHYQIAAGLGLLELQKPCQTAGLRRSGGIKELPSRMI